MPSRFVTLSILAFWLAMVGLFLYADIWPRLVPSEPLMFPVDVVDEAGPQRGEDSDFAVARGDTTRYTNEVEWPYRALVEWRYHREDDSFESKMVLADTDTTLLNMLNIYRLTRAGDMKAIETTTTYRLPPSDAGAMTVKVELTGSPRDAWFIPHIQRTFPDHKDGTGIDSQAAREAMHAGEAVPVSQRGTVLNPLHPPRRFTDLAADQHWQLTVIDPAPLLGLVPSVDASKSNSVSGSDVAARAYVLEARVLPQIKTIAWQNEKEVPCRVIRCIGDGPVRSLTFWVRQRDGAQGQPGYKTGEVMQQEVALGDTIWTFRRLPPGYKMRSLNRPRNTP